MIEITKFVESFVLFWPSSENKRRKKKLVSYRLNTPQGAVLIQFQSFKKGTADNYYFDNFSGNYCKSRNIREKPKILNFILFFFDISKTTTDRTEQLYIR